MTTALPLSLKFENNAGERLAKCIHRTAVGPSVPSAVQLSTSEKNVLLKVLTDEIRKHPFYQATTSKLQDLFLRWQDAINGARRTKGLREYCCKAMLSALDGKFFEVSNGCAFACTKESYVLDHNGMICMNDLWNIAFRSNKDEDFAKAKEIRPYPQDVYRELYTSRELAKAVGWTMQHIECAKASNNQGIVTYLSKYSPEQLQPILYDDTNRRMADALQGTLEEKILACSQSQNFGIAIWLVNQASATDLSTDLAKAALRIANQAGQTHLENALKAKGVSSAKNQ